MNTKNGENIDMYAQLNKLNKKLTKADFDDIVIKKCRSNR